MAIMLVAVLMYILYVLYMYFLSCSQSNSVISVALFRYVACDISFHVGDFQMVVMTPTRSTTQLDALTMSRNNLLPKCVYKLNFMCLGFTLIKRLYTIVAKTIRLI